MAAECARGHPRTPENTYVSGKGKKQCRICALARSTQGRRDRGWKERMVQTISPLICLSQIIAFAKAPYQHLAAAVEPEARALWEPPIRDRRAS